MRVTGRRKLAKGTPLAFLVAAAGLLAIPSGASAATQIGQTFDPSADPCDAETVLQSTSPAGQYAAPSDGVTTRWSFRAPVGGTDQLKFKVARPAGGDSFTMIGESALVDPVADTLNSYFIQIPVKAGDIIGLFWNPGNTANCARVASSDYKLHSEPGDVVPPTTAGFTEESGFQLDLSASLEPDCDKDGLGDETQDTNLSACVTTPLTCKGQRLSIVGTPSGDEIVGTPSRDVIAAQGGNDKVSGLGGNDLICGGSGKDKLKGGPGKDTLLGQGGNDILKGGGANDLCKGGKGKDTLSSC